VIGCCQRPRIEMFSQMHNLKDSLWILLENTLSRQVEAKLFRGTINSTKSCEPKDLCTAALNVLMKEITFRILPFKGKAGTVS
jgi:hypothetical protein